MLRLHMPDTNPSNNDVFLPAPQEAPHVRRQLDDLLAEVCEVVSPVWPLQDYVAVNPYSGVTERQFMASRRFLQLISDCETLMPLGYYRTKFEEGAITEANIEAAIDELGLGDTLDAPDVIEAMLNDGSGTSTENSHRIMRTIAEYVDRGSEVQWTEAIVGEVSKFCAAHYDDGQSVWNSPWKHMPLFEAWRSASVIDRNMETLGLTGFRAFVDGLPHSSDAAIVWLLQRLEIPESLWKPFLLCQAFSIPGWGAWAKYQDNWSGKSDEAPSTDLIDLLAIRLAYDVALSEATDTHIQWSSICHNDYAAFDMGTDLDASCRYVLLRATEITVRDELLTDISTKVDERSQAAEKRAQLVFCIDVRSERIRRHLESQSDEIETFGFAGFFGMPIEHVPLGQEDGHSHVPVIAKPMFKLRDSLRESSDSCETKTIERLGTRRSWLKLWKGLQNSAVSSFSFVETLGLFYGWKLLRRATGFVQSSETTTYDGLDAASKKRLGPSMDQLEQQGIDTTVQVELAASMLKNIGLTENYGRLVVFCGHASQTQNNPLAAGLDCGACGGHSGEPNARLAAMLLNQDNIRSALADRGIEIPDSTYFLGGLHNTTTDSVTVFDVDRVPESHHDDVQQLVKHLAVASKQTSIERMPLVASKTVADMLRRAVDWSEVRPEWGLAGNAAFIAAPRSMTKNTSLNGRAFLHSYEHQNDTDDSVLESIMTAPMVVAHWINMQYYASTVDNQNFGSGNKTVHNVVGRFGILSGNGGDLQTGLPWQSIHDGADYFHEPLRLQSILAAPRASIDQVIEKHEALANLLNNGWMHLVAIEDQAMYRYSDSGWQPLAANQIEPLQTV